MANEGYRLEGIIFGREARGAKQLTNARKVTSTSGFEVFKWEKLEKMKLLKV